MYRARTLLAATLLASLAAFPIVAAAQTGSTAPAASSADASDATKAPKAKKKFSLKKPSGAAAAANKAKEPASAPGEIGAKQASTPK